MTEIPSQLEQWESKVNRLMVKAENAKSAYTQARDRLSETTERLSAIESAQNIAQVVAQSIQEKVHAKISSVVSRCLSTVFEDPYQFKVLFERKRGRTEAILTFERNGNSITRPTESSGGGCVDIAAMALRLSALMLQRPKLQRIILMDEPFKSPSKKNDYRAKSRQLIETLTKEMGIQFITITNIEELESGNIIDIEEL